MTDQATRVVPAGWYEDPASTAHVRWWNGLAWTEHTTLKPSTPPRPQPAAEPQLVTTATGSIHTAETLARIAEARELERQYGISTAEHDVIVRAATEGAAQERAEAQPMSRRENRAAVRTSVWEDEFDDAEDGTSTASSWFIALWPVLTLVAAIAAAYVYFYVTPEPSLAGIPLIAGVVVVPYLLGIVWAIADARKLRARGHRPPSPVLALLGPLVYLIARRVKVSGTGPLVTLIVLTLLAAGGPVAAALTGAAYPATKALEIQQTIRADYVGSGQLASVNCPMFVESVTAGTLYTCNGTTPEGASKRVWVSIENADGAFAYALAVR